MFPEKKINFAIYFLMKGILKIGYSKVIFIEAYAS